MTNDEAADRITLPAAPAPPRKRGAHRWQLVAVLACVTMLSAMAVVFYAMRAVSADRDGWKGHAAVLEQQNDHLREQVEVGAKEAECRSRASFDTVASLARVVESIAQLVIAQGDTEAGQRVRDNLPTFVAILDDALARQDAAIPSSDTARSTCDVEPSTTTTTGG